MKDKGTTGNKTLRRQTMRKIWWKILSTLTQLQCEGFPIQQNEGNSQTQTSRTNTVGHIWAFTNTSMWQGLKAPELPRLPCSPCFACLVRFWGEICLAGEGREEKRGNIAVFVVRHCTNVALLAAMTNSLVNFYGILSLCRHCMFGRRRATWMRVTRRSDCRLKKKFSILRWVKIIWIFLCFKRAAVRLPSVFVLHSLHGVAVKPDEVRIIFNSKRRRKNFTDVEPTVETKIRKVFHKRIFSASSKNFHIDFPPIFLLPITNLTSSR